MNSTPPQPPPKNADRKALAAFHSELRRWADALTRWEASLDVRETQLANDVQFVEEMEHWKPSRADSVDEDSDLLDTPIDTDDDCDCTTENAKDGCDCPPCREWRSRRAQKMMVSQQDAVKTGDEVQWLESLWNLPDRRRKKK